MNDVYIRISTLNKWVAKHFNGDLISIDDLIGCIEDLDSDIEYYKKELEDLKQDVEENYRRIPIAEQVGISDKDFV